MARSIIHITPSIEHRLSAWDTIHDHLAAQRTPRVRPTVTLSRAFGCEGFAVADGIKQRLEAASDEPWNVYDKTLLEAVAKDEGIPMRTLKNLGETARSLERLGLMPPEFYAHAEAFKEVATHLVQLATVGNAVIVGRGGAVLCRGLANCFHVRLEAPLEWRIASIERRLEMKAHEARAFVDANEHLREEFIRDQLKVNPTDLSFFDAVFNNARRTPEEIAEAVVAMVRSAWPKDSGYFKR